MRLAYSYYLFFWLSAGAVHAAPADTLRLPSRHTRDVSPSARRWRGTIGQQAVTLTLDSTRWGYSGSYYYDHRGQALQLTQKKTRPHSALTLSESVSSSPAGPTGYFIFSGAIGPQLAGTWRSPDGKRQLPFLLRETYIDAARYQTEYWQLNRYLPMASAADSTFNTATLSQDYLCISLPQRPAAEQRLRQALGPPVPTPRMAHYLDTLAARRQAQVPDYSRSGYKLVTYNSNYLLSVIQLDNFRTDPQEEDSTGIVSHEWQQGHTFDLHTGRRLQLADLLLPGYQPRLRQLVLKQLRAAWQQTPYDGIGADGKLPASGFYLTPTGLGFSYDDRADTELAFPGPYHADRSVEIEVPYAALLPLINPSGPLAPLLQERRLLPAKQPR